MDGTLILFNLVAFLVSGIFHEQAHARVALWLGDPTARDQKRLTWDPGPHIDPIMTILVPIIALVSTGGRSLFGMMKPVPIQATNFQNPTLGMLLSGVAGPISNAILATAGLLLLGVMLWLAPSAVWSPAHGQLTFNGLFLCVFIMMNFILGGFNLLPLPGLDGMHFLYHFLPRAAQAFLDRLAPVALMITMAIAFNVPGLFNSVMVLFFRLLQAFCGDPFANAFLDRLK